jgi:hypothetical protein
MPERSAGATCPWPPTAKCQICHGSWSWQSVGSIIQHLLTQFTYCVRCTCKNGMIEFLLSWVFDIGVNLNASKMGTYVSKVISFLQYFSSHFINKAIHSDQGTLLQNRSKVKGKPKDPRRRRHNIRGEIISPCKTAGHHHPEPTKTLPSMLACPLSSAVKCLSCNQTPSTRTRDNEVRCIG